MLAASWATPAQAIDAVQRAAAAVGFESEQTGPESLRLSGRVRPYWALAAAGLLFLPTLGLSLLLLRVKVSGAGTATLVNDANGLHVRLSGQLPEYLPAVITEFLSQPQTGAVASPSAVQQPSQLAVAPAMQPSSAPYFRDEHASPRLTGERMDAPQRAEARNGALVNGGGKRHATAPLASLNGTVTPYDGSPWAPALSTTSVPMSEIGDINATMARPRVIDLTGGAPLLVFDDGVSVTLTGFALIGRAPSAGSGDPAAQLLSIADPELSVSKTHLAMGRDSQGLWVCDRNSTNGSSITHPDGTTTTCIPGQRHYVDTGCTVQVGARSFSIAFAGIPLGRSR